MLAVMDKDCSYKCNDINKLLSKKLLDMDQYVTRGEFIQFEKRIDDKLDTQTDSINRLRDEFKYFESKMDKKMWIMVRAIVIGVILNNFDALLNFISNLF